MSDLPPDDQAASSLSGKSDDPQSSQQKLHQMLAALWERSRKTVAGHVEILKEANALAAKNELDEPSRVRAVDSAHKLAGVLGTFGLPRGTELARVAEEAFGHTVAIRRDELRRLSSALDELDKLIQGAGTYTRAHPS